MIDWNKSAELNMCNVDELKARFDRFPKSGKKVVAICDNPECNKERIIGFGSYRELCGSCASKISQGTDEARKQNSDRNKRRYRDPMERKKISDGNIKRFSDPNERKKQSDRLKRYYINNPSAATENGDRQIQWCADHPEYAEAQSERRKEWHKNHPEFGTTHSDFMIRWHTDENVDEKILRGKKHSATSQGISIDKWNGYTDKSQPHLVPKANCIHLNPIFHGCNQHHIMSGVIINIPCNIHNDIYHRMPKDGIGGKNMKEINEIAMEYLLGGL